MKLAVFSGQYFWFDGRHYSTDEAFVRFVASFHPYFEKITFCDAVAKESKTQAYILDPTNTEVCALPYFSVYSFWKNIFVIYPRIYRAIRDNIQDWDIIWLPAPHPLTLIIAYLCHRKDKPFFLVIRQNLIEQIKHNNRGTKKSCAIAAVAILEHITRRIAEKNLTFTVGREMYKRYRRSGSMVYEVAVSLISEKDIENTITAGRAEPCSPVRLLSVGRLDPEKGLNFLIEALEVLIREKRLNVSLRIVGKSYKDGEERRLRQQLEKRELAKYVHFAGYVPHGPRLFELYRESDIFILPSLTGEGVPQTLFEAMASGIPVIATRVAGIPYLIEDGENGLLINPGCPREISEAIMRIITNAELGRCLARNGLFLARRHTLEVERDRMISCIEEFLKQARPKGVSRRMV